MQVIWLTPVLTAQGHAGDCRSIGPNESAWTSDENGTEPLSAKPISICLPRGIPAVCMVQYEHFLITL